MLSQKLILLFTMLLNIKEDRRRDYIVLIEL